VPENIATTLSLVTFGLILEFPRKLKRIPSNLTKYDSDADIMSVGNFVEPRISWIRGLKRLGREAECSLMCETGQQPEAETNHSHLPSPESAPVLSHTCFYEKCLTGFLNLRDSAL
jgi:hypothetical protein